MQKLPDAGKSTMKKKGSTSKIKPFNRKKSVRLRTSMLRKSACANRAVKWTRLPVCDPGDLFAAMVKANAVKTLTLGYLGWLFG